jgi:hypothetical protein
MKVSPKADFPVKVVRQEWEQEPPTAPLYHGIFTVTLNHVVHVAFVPDVSDLAPPWDDHLLPADFDEISTEAQARVATGILASYVVTSNEKLADTTETFAWDLDSEFGPSTGVVFYVHSKTFQGYAAELAELAERNAGSFYPKQTVSELPGLRVVEFLRTHVLRPRWLSPDHAAMLEIA